MSARRQKVTHDAFRRHIAIAVPASVPNRRLRGLAGELVYPLLTGVTRLAPVRSEYAHTAWVTRVVAASRCYPKYQVTVSFLLIAASRSNLGRTRLTVYLGKYAA